MAEHALPETVTTAAAAISRVKTCRPFHYDRGHDGYGNASWLTARRVNRTHWAVNESRIFGPSIDYTATSTELLTALAD
jgi:hypothetical protein